jgi:tripartite-type tricarboxylate transporter receptor subunit TctC
MFASMAGHHDEPRALSRQRQATTDLIGGQVLVSIPGLAGMLGHIKSGRLRALAVTGVQRSPQLPEVPTLAESGLRGYSAYVWLGLLAPKGTPAAVIDRLHRELLAALAANEVKTYMNSASISGGSVTGRIRRLFPR